ncbi:MAG: molybdopterin-synthase adenylyltransferase MoeB [Thermoanaerobaculia bacterium]
MLTSAERSRYARHIILPEIGEAGQERLKRSSVLIIGAGGLGSPAATYLAAAGVGRIGLVDPDVVDISNLHRQILYGDSAAGELKVDAARRRLADVNPHVAIETFPQRLTSHNALEVIRPYDVVLDGTDNFPTRYLVNDACVLTGKPNVYGSIFRFEGQASVFGMPDGPCYRCLYPEPPPPGLVPSCAVAGVFGVLPGVVGTIQATEAIKVITGAGETLAGRLLLFDALSMSFRQLRVQKNAACPLCGPAATITDLIDYEEFCNPLTGTDITPTQLSEKLAGGEELVLIDVREPHEWDAGRLENARHIPLGQLPQRLAEIPRDRKVVVYCRSGARSANAKELLERSGFAHVANLLGGITRWSREVDPNVRVV